MNNAMNNAMNIGNYIHFSNHKSQFTDHCSLITKICQKT